nr:hypothetical protein [Akkermansiaceae bacterium]
CLEAGLAPGVTFLLSASGIDKRRAFWKFLEKHANLRLFDKIDTTKDGWEEEVAALVHGRARDLGLSFEDEAMELFVMQAGEATRQIGSELEKIDLFLGPDRRTVTLEDVRVMVPMSRAGIVFEIGKALQTGDAARAIELIDRLLESGESAIGLMRALDRLAPLQRAALPQKKTGGVNVYPLYLALGSAEAFRFESLRDLMESALKADKSLVTTGLDHRLVLHRFVAEMTAAVEKKRK